VSLNTPSVIVSILQVAAGGTIVQGVLAFFRRRSELRQLDTAADNVIVGSAEHVVVLLRTELDDAKDEIKQLKKDHTAEIADFQRQITRLGEEVSKVRAENVVMKAEINRLQGGSS
jgi:peptidoglycan hydrolase CwlO-like protein